MPPAGHPKADSKLLTSDGALATGTAAELRILALALVSSAHPTLLQLKELSSDVEDEADDGFPGEDCDDDSDNKDDLD